MAFNIKPWLKLSLLNLCIVAFLGVLMRYKIGFEFPYLDQKHLQHSHSHFAFSGWITHTLMTLMIYFLQAKIVGFSGNKYNKTIIANLICSYGMLISFIIQGYGMYSIFFTTSTIAVSCFFGYQYFKDLKRIDNDSLSKNWFKAALVFNVFSSIGTFYLAYMMVTKNVIQDLYLSSIYFYLHFQYNGWFFFACIGLFIGLLGLKKTDHPFYETTFKLFALSCVPAYFLSVLWLELPLWLYLITVAAAIIQVYAWFRFITIVIKTKTKVFENYPGFLRYILIFAGVALGLKLLLQLGSTIPSLSEMAFGFRPIVIAYLHLILLAVYSLFLLFYIYVKQVFIISNKIKTGVLLFAIGVFLNEIVLAIQGIAAFSYTSIPYVNGMLFSIALLLFFSIGFTLVFTLKKNKNSAIV
ncbi:hypothetical protein [Flavobacterium sp. K5-23]|uniref:hypothetical protein n=1 Tax=Flavobacterium sp. K5-23 TaxID=2746225 RepID=UPI00200E41E6|nr:hypothetical protein [Flavobacterium sp. K5-23]UQD54967.1 hypothetical protein FLAK523_00620 [Flavobacterium sp. K5-23]